MEGGGGGEQIDYQSASVDDIGTSEFSQNQAKSIDHFTSAAPCQREVRSTDSPIPIADQFCWLFFCCFYNSSDTSSSDIFNQSQKSKSDNTQSSTKGF